MSFDRSKVIAILTGAISLVLGIAYLILVQVLDSRGEMVPAPSGSVFGMSRVVYTQVHIQKMSNSLFLVEKIVK